MNFVPGDMLFHKERGPVKYNFQCFLRQSLNPDKSTIYVDMMDEIIVVSLDDCCKLNDFSILGSKNIS